MNGEVTSGAEEERTGPGLADSDPGTGPSRHWSHNPGQGNINISGGSRLKGSCNRITDENHLF